MANESGFCECGCGQRTKLAKQSDTKLGWVKGQPIRFVRGHTTRTGVVKPGNYRKIGLELEHVLIAERALGRKLRGAEEVHHVDGNEQNNANSNLVICQSRAYHMFLHARARVIRAGGNPETQKLCNKCRRVLNLDRFYSFKLNASSQRHSFCKECDSAYAAARRQNEKQ